MTASVPIAVLADVHANRWALDAVIADAERAGARRFVDLGDSVAGPLDPAGTAERLIALGAVAIRGNHDRAVLDGDPGASAAFARERLRAEQLDWLAGLPTSAWVEEDVLLCHGSPGDDEEYLLEEVVPDRARHRAPDGVLRLLEGGNAMGASLVLCGHSHLPRLLPLDGGPFVANPGSVGLPAYDHDLPHPHVMESGSPHARYALIRRSGPGHGWRVELRTVAYDWDVAAAAAREHGREDWAISLETGLAPPTIARRQRSSQGRPAQVANRF